MTGFMKLRDNSIKIFFQSLFKLIHWVNALYQLLKKYQIYLTKRSQHSMKLVAVVVWEDQFSYLILQKRFFSILNKTKKKNFKVINLRGMNQLQLIIYKLYRVNAIKFCNYVKFSQIFKRLKSQNLNLMDLNLKLIFHSWFLLN